MQWAHWREAIGNMRLSDGSQPAAYVLSEADYDRLQQNGYLDHQKPSGNDYFSAPQLNGRVLFDSPEVPDGRIVLIHEKVMPTIIERLQQMEPLNEQVDLTGGTSPGVEISLQPGN